MIKTVGLIGLSVAYLACVAVAVPKWKQGIAGGNKISPQDEFRCQDPSTPRINPNGIVSEAEYGAPCNDPSENDCLNGMDCCYNNLNQRVCEDINECANGDACCAQICTNNNGTYTCACFPGYMLAADGFSCVDVPECNAASCSGVGVCNEEVGGGIVCVCDAGYTGADCSSNIDDCSPNPCSNGGTCNDLVDAFSCACTAPWTGFTCGTDVVDCTGGSCSGNGVCNEESGGGVVCECTAGWTGADCSTNIDDCSPNPCSNGGTCSDLVDAFSCACAAPWTGFTCGTDVTECDSTSCSGNGECLEEVGGGFTCCCNDGWTGSDCSTDIDECATGALTCGENSQCFNTPPGSATCQCDDGYQTLPGASNENSCPLREVESVALTTWCQQGIANYLKSPPLPALSELTVCFYFEPKPGVTDLVYNNAFLISIATSSDDNAWTLGWPSGNKLGLTDTDQYLTSSADELAVFQQKHHHCFVWKDNQYLKWYLDEVREGELNLRATTGDSGPGANGPIGKNGVLVPLNDQDTVGGGLQENQVFSGFITDIQVWGTALTDSQMVNLVCGAEGDVFKSSDFIVVGTPQAGTDNFSCLTDA